MRQFSNAQQPAAVGTAQAQSNVALALQQIPVATDAPATASAPAARAGRAQDRSRSAKRDRAKKEMEKVGAEKTVIEAQLAQIQQLQAKQAELEARLLTLQKELDECEI